MPAPATDLMTAYTQAITRTYPKLAVESVRLNQDGQYSDVLVVNDALIFRFPKYAESIEGLQREVRLLDTIRDYITLEIPAPMFQNLEAQRVGEVFIGYPMIPGEPLWLENFQAIEDLAALERMALQLGGFLHELHSVPIAKLKPRDRQPADTRAAYVDMYSRIQAKLFPHMREEARQQVTHHFTEYFEHIDAYAFEPRLRHGDFGTGNILYDPATLTITGILDFGGATRGDPAVDFAGLLGYGEEFCKPCAQVYPGLEQMQARIRFYRGTFALEEALFGVENGDERAFASGIQQYI